MAPAGQRTLEAVGPPGRPRRRPAWAGRTTDGGEGVAPERDERAGGTVTAPRPEDGVLVTGGRQEPTGPEAVHERRVEEDRDQLPPAVERMVDGPPQGLRKHADGSKEMVLSMGPQHPSTHGVLRLQLRVDGERIIEVKPDIGYLHRSWEKIVEAWSFPQIIPFSDRNDYLAGIHNEHVLCLAVERLMGIEVPERAEYIRVIMAELQRLCSHLIWIGTFALDLGATSVFLWTFNLREQIYNLFELVTGGRLFPQFLRIGGVRNDFPEGFYHDLPKVLANVERGIEEVHGMLTGNPIFRTRTVGVGRLPAELALQYGCSGPMLRGSGIAYDVRRADPYSLYGRFDFAVPTQTEGDVFARYQVRLAEMGESMKIIRQAMEALPAEGPVMGDIPRKFKPPEGEVFAHVESPRGDLGVYLVSDGSPQPFRLKWRSPCFSNLQSVEAMAVGSLLGDLVAIVGSIDIVLGEVDR